MRKLVVDSAKTYRTASGQPSHQSHSGRVLKSSGLSCLGQDCLLMLVAVSDRVTRPWKTGLLADLVEQPAEPRQWLITEMFDVPRNCVA
jgi:hypothetical protein